MFLRTRYNNTTIIDDYWKEYYQLYRTTIVSTIQNGWKQEDVWGITCDYNIVRKFQYTFFYVLMIYLEIKRGIVTDWTYYEVKYDILNVRKCLTCYGIRLDDVFDIFNLNNGEYGIENIGIELTYEVEPDTLPITGGSRYYMYHGLNYTTIHNNLINKTFNLLDV